jgi:Tfp pilus assembly protein PilN
MLTRTMPRGAILTAISVDMQNKTIEIEGSAQRSSVVLEALERSGLFRDITYSGPITIKEGKENFKFRMVTR